MDRFIKEIDFDDAHPTNLWTKEVLRTDKETLPECIDKRKKMRRRQECDKVTRNKTSTPTNVKTPVSDTSKGARNLRGWNFRLLKSKRRLMPTTDEKKPKKITSRIEPGSAKSQ